MNRLKGAWRWGQGWLSVAVGLPGRWQPTWEAEHWWATALAAAGLAGLALILTDRLFLYGGDIGGLPGEKWDYSNRLYLLSSIAQTLAAILALVVSLTLVATQLAAQNYGPRVVRLRMRDHWLWAAVGIYLVAILWALLFHGRLELLGEKSASIALLLAGEALLYLIPFTLATLRSVDPVRTLAATGQYTALAEMIRKAAQDDQMGTVADALDALGWAAWAEVATGRLDRVDRLGDFIHRQGTYLVQRRSLEGYQLVADRLTDLAIRSRQAGYALAATILEGYRSRLDEQWKGGAP